jgi:hypothetical protein
MCCVQRVNTAESEDGFQWIDNSCFPRFNNMAAFVAYLRSTDPTAYSRDSGGSATALSTGGLHMLLAVLVMVAWVLLH